MNRSEKILLVSFLALGMCLVDAGSIRLHAATAGSDQVTPDQAPTVVSSDTSILRQALLARMAFDELRFELAGVVTFQGQTSCLIKRPGQATTARYQVGDTIDGYCIESIDRNGVVFRNGDDRFALGMGELDAEEAAVSVDQPEAIENSESGELDLDTPSGAEFAEGIPVLRAKHGKIVKTRHYAVKKLIEDGSAAGRRNARYRGRLASVQSNRFIRPIKGRTTSPFGYRKHPLGGQRRFHRGVDIATRSGNAPVKAAAAGVIVKRSYTPILGRYIVIQHKNGYETMYAHLSRRLVQVGQKVSQGQAIGREGSTGRTTGPHLHFEIHKNGVAVNPRGYIQ